jgi:hypothetical protein
MVSMTDLYGRILGFLDWSPATNLKNIYPMAQVLVIAHRQTNKHDCNKTSSFYFIKHLKAEALRVMLDVRLLSPTLSSRNLSACNEITKVNL